MGGFLVAGYDKRRLSLQAYVIDFFQNLIYCRA